MNLKAEDAGHGVLTSQSQPSRIRCPRDRAGVEALGELRVAVVDDDLWKRASMADQLSRDPRITVAHEMDQDTAATWDGERWRGVDVALVDVYDDRAPGETGTDLYSGVSAVARLRSAEVRVVAVTPHCPHPLVQLRLALAAPDWLYSRWEVPNVEALVAALLRPDPDHRPKRPDRAVLERLGASRAEVNDAVATYVASPIHGRLEAGIGLKSLPLSRRRMDAFRAKIARHGLVSTETLSTADHAVRVPRWPDVRDFLLRSIGRLEVPASEFESPWWGS